MTLETHKYSLQFVIRDAIVPEVSPSGQGLLNGMRHLSPDPCGFPCVSHSVILGRMYNKPFYSSSKGEVVSQEALLGEWHRKE